MSKMIDEKRMLNIYLSGYGPNSMFTLKEYLEACDYVRANRTSLFKRYG